MICLFSASWCGPCRSYKKLLTDLGINYKVIDIEEEIEISSQYKISTVPTLIRIEDEAVKIRIEGMCSKNHLEQSGILD